MGYRYREFKVVTEDMIDDLANVYREYNRSLLADGVKGVGCLDSRAPHLWERIDLISYIPSRCHISHVEMYENGAANYFVRNHLEKQIGVLTYRPLTNSTYMI